MPEFSRGWGHHVPRQRRRRDFAIVPPAPVTVAPTLPPLTPLEPLTPPVPTNTAAVTPPVPAVPTDGTPAPPPIPGAVGSLNTPAPAVDALSGFGPSFGADPFAALASSGVASTAPGGASVAPSASPPWLWIGAGALLLAIVYRKGWV